MTGAKVIFYEDKTTEQVVHSSVLKLMSLLK
jgi:hypothetical protein